MIVVEEASVHASDWPYERCPLAAECGAGLGGGRRRVPRATARSCSPRSATAGGQGSSRLQPARRCGRRRGCPRSTAREVPKWMEADDIAAVVDGLRRGGRGWPSAPGSTASRSTPASTASCASSCPGLTNQRDDEWGTGPAALRPRGARRGARRRRAASAVVGPAPVVRRAGAVGRASCPKPRPSIAVGARRRSVDYVAVVRGAIFTVSADPARRSRRRPASTSSSCRSIRGRGRRRPVAGGRCRARSSTPARPSGRSTTACCDAVEMTRAQIADPDLGRASSPPARPSGSGPCILCNQTCQVRDARNPIVSCVGEPASGHELEDAAGRRPPRPVTARDVLVVGGGVAGLETARVAALPGPSGDACVERPTELGGAVRVAAAGGGRERLVVLVRLARGRVPAPRRDDRDRHVDDRRRAGRGRRGRRRRGARAPARPDGEPGYDVDERRRRASPPSLDVLRSATPPAVPPRARWRSGTRSAARSACRSPRLLPREGRDVHLVTPDLIAGNELARTGDLAPANVRLPAPACAHRAAIDAAARRAGAVELEDRFTGERRERHGGGSWSTPATGCPTTRSWRERRRSAARAGDAVAPRHRSTKRSLEGSPAPPLAPRGLARG